MPSLRFPIDTNLLPADMVFFAQIIMEAAEESRPIRRTTRRQCPLFLDAMRQSNIKGALVGVVLSGVTGSQRLDTLVIAKPMRDCPWLQHHKSEMAVTRHLARLLEIALHFAREGREGSSIGAIFVLGDRRELSPHLRQLILNPLKGHAQAARSIHNPDFLETFRELTAMDGALVVNRRGFVDSAGTYLNASVGERLLSPGLGARHAAALAVTAVTDATAVVVSASSGTVTVYDDGGKVLELERAHTGSCV